MLGAAGKMKSALRRVMMHFIRRLKGSGATLFSSQVNTVGVEMLLYNTLD